MRTIAAISATIGFLVLSLACLQLVLGWTTPGSDNSRLWIGAAVAGAVAAIAGTAVVRSRTN